MRRAVVVLALARPALAVEGGVGLVTDVPLDLGVLAEIDLPWRLGAAATVGFVPPPYIDVITAVVDDPTVTDILEQNLKSAMTAGVELRGRLWRGLGLGVGFRWFGLQGGFLGCDILELETGQTFCPAGGPRPRAVEIEVSSDIYATTFSLGWRFEPRPWLSLYAGASFLYALGSSTSVETRSARAEEALDAYLDEIYTTYLKVPYLALAATYRFGRR